MRKPDWFILIEQWVPRGMGKLGPTFPFLVGAIAYKARQAASMQQGENILDDIVQRPLEDYVIEIRWCSDIKSPVLSAKRIDARYQMSTKATIPRPSGSGDAMVFASNLVQWQSKDGRVLLKRLLEDSETPISDGCCSRVWNKKIRDFEYVSFLPWEIQYIQDTIMMSEK